MNEKLSQKIILRELFPTTDFENWKQMVEADLKGAPFEKKLITKTYEGIDLQPLYTTESLENLPAADQFPGLLNFLRGSTAGGSAAEGWLIAQSLLHPLAEEYNALLLNALNKGQNAIILPLDVKTRSGLDADYGSVELTGAGGVSVSGIGSLTRAFKDVDLTACPIFINTGAAPLAFFSIFSAWLKKNGKELSGINGAIYGDPTGTLFELGKIHLTLDEAYKQIAGLTQLITKECSNLKTAGIDTTPYAEKGANSVQELGIALASAVEMILQLKKHGVEPEKTVLQLFFRFGISTNLFMEIAKFRAFRILFSELLKQMDIKPEVSPKIAAKTTGYYHSFVDPFVNLLRVTTGAFSAVAGGVSVIETTPYDSLFAQSDEFSNRVARNTQLILSEESHLNHVTDPGGGSYYIETLTNEIANKAWAYFREIEEEGGIVAALHSGKINNDIAAVAEKRIKDAATRKAVLVGVNSYVNVKEAVKAPKPLDSAAVYKRRADELQKLRVQGSPEHNREILIKLQEAADENNTELTVEKATEAALLGATLGELFNHLKGSSDTTEVPALQVARPAEQFENLHLRAAAHLAKTGDRIKVYLFTVGPVKQYKARADFSRGFFEAGGCRVIYGNSVNSPAEGIDAAVASGAEVFVLCSTDETYPELVPQFVSGIKTAKPDAVTILAGYPKDQVEAHKAAGIDDFIFLGANVVDIISQIFDKTGVEK